MAENTQKDWSISELYEKSWEIIKNNKVLWVFGMAVVGLASGANSNFNFEGSDFGSIERLFKQTSPATSSQLMTIINQFFSSIPIYFYILLGIETLTAIVLAIVWGVVHSSWAQASLISGIQTALNGDKPTIRDSSEKAFPSLKPLAWLQIVPGLVLILVSLIVFSILGFGLVVGTNTLKVIFVILLILAFIVFIYALIYLVLSQIWALRSVVLDKKPAKFSLVLGYKIAKKKFWSMILLGLVNTIFSSLIVFVPMVIIGGILIGGVLSFTRNQALGVGLIGTGGLLGIIFLLSLLLLSGVLIAFKAATWTIAYNKVKEKYDENS